MRCWMLSDAQLPSAAGLKAARLPHAAWAARTAKQRATGRQFGSEASRGKDAWFSLEAAVASPPVGSSRGFSHSFLSRAFSIMVGVLTIAWQDCSHRHAVRLLCRPSECYSKSIAWAAGRLELYILYHVKMFTSRSARPICCSQIQ